MYIKQHDTTCVLLHVYYNNLSKQSSRIKTFIFNAYGLCRSENQNFIWLQKIRAHIVHIDAEKNMKYYIARELWKTIILS